MNTQRISVILTILSLFLFTSLAAPDVRSPTHSFTTLDPPGAVHTDDPSINASGQVAGSYVDNSLHTHGFVYSNGTFTILDVPGAIDTWVSSINDSGQVTGSYGDDLNAHWNGHGFVYGNGTFTTLDVPGAAYTGASSINANGQVAGSYGDSSYNTHGFVYGNGTFTTFDAPGAVNTYPISINASGQVAGYYHDGSYSHGFLYSNGTFTTLDGPGAISSGAYSINDSGQVTGSYCNYLHPRLGFSDCHGFVYSDGTFTTLDVPGAERTGASSINANGQVAGSYGYSSGEHGFVYSDGTFTTLDVPGAGTRAARINDSGQVTGSYSHGDGHRHGFIATPICTTPTVAVYTLTTMPQGELRITGSITHEGAPLCALVLANGQFMFTCGDPLPKGDFDLTAPLDDQGQITLFGFSAGLAPFQQSLEPGALPAAAKGTRCTTPTVTPTVTAAPDGRFRLTGSITLGGDSLCALVLANGQFLFTCGDPLPKGDFDLTVPLDDQGHITLFGFSAGLAPFQQTFSPAPFTLP